MHGPDWHRSDFLVHQDIAKAAEALPDAIFTDPLLHQYLLNTLYRSEWLVLPRHHYFNRVSDRGGTLWAALQRSGASEKIEYLGEPLLFNRGVEPEENHPLHCVVGICPHNSGSLARAKTDRRGRFYIQCPVHSLRTDCAGNFQAFPGLANPTPEQREALTLRQYHTRVWLDFLFLCRGNPIAPWHQVISPLIQIVSRLPLEQFVYTPHYKEVRRVPISPLLNADNYCDWKHITGGVHSGQDSLEGAIKMEKYKWDVYDHMLLQWAYAVNPEDGFEPEFLPEWFSDRDDPTSRVYAVWLFEPPNITWNFHRWGLSLNVYSPIYDQPEATEFLWFHYVWDRERYDRAISLLYKVDAEDIEELTEIQRNKRLDPRHRGPISPDEIGRHWLHRRISRALG